MIRFGFARTQWRLLCIAAASASLGVFAAEQGQTNAIPVKAPATTTNGPVVVVTPPAPAAPQPPPLSAPPGVTLTNLSFDAETKEYEAKPGEGKSEFTFNFKNTSAVPVHILGVHASCGCTAAKLPPMPWVIQPGTNDQLSATMQIGGKPPGRTTKTLTLSSTNGTKVLYVTAIIPPPAPATMTDTQRQQNIELAKADRQAVFKNDCAACHAPKSKTVMGAALYKEVCGVCHDSEHRATMVPDILALNRPPDTNYWRATISNGIEKPGSLMPAFSQDHGGPLTKEQIESLVAYMINDFPREHKPTVQVKLPDVKPEAPKPPQTSAPPAPPAPPAVPGAPTVLPVAKPIK